MKKRLRSKAHYKAHQRQPRYVVVTAYVMRVYGMEPIVVGMKRLGASWPLAGMEMT